MTDIKVGVLPIFPSKVVGDGLITVTRVNGVYTIGVNMATLTGSVVDFSTLHSYASEKLNANRTYYVRTDGNDANNGLVNSSSGAFATIQQAVNAALALDLNIYNVTIQVADSGGSPYTGGVYIGGPFKGAGTVTIQGNTTTPANAVVSVTSNNAFSITNGAAVSIAGFKVQTTTNGTGVIATGGAVVNLSAMNFGACASMHMEASGNAYITLTGDYTISGSAQGHVHTPGGQVLFFGGTNPDGSPHTGVGTVSGTPAFTWFAGGSQNGTLSYRSFGYSGAATGARYLVHTGALIDTGTFSETFLPGNSAGSAYDGGQYNGNLGTLWLSADNTYDIGAYSTGRPRAIYAGTSIQSPWVWGINNLYVGGFASQIQSATDGVIALTNNAGTNFTRLQLGGTTSSFPAIKRNGTALNFRLADDSADAPITASTGNFSGSVKLTNNTPVTGRNTGGIDKSLISLNVADNVEVGYSGLSGLFLYGAQVSAPTDNTGSLGALNYRWSAIHSMGLTLYGATSGSGVLSAPATAGSRTWAFPAASGTIDLADNAATLQNKSISGSANTLTNIGNSSLTNSTITIGSSSVSLGATLSVITGLSLSSPTINTPVISSPTGIVKGDVGLGNVANVDTTNASNISSGTLGSARLPAFSGDISTSAGSSVTAIGATKVTSAMLNADVFSTAHSWAGIQTFATPVINGTPTGTGVATAATANTLALRDASGILTASGHVGIRVGTDVPYSISRVVVVRGISLAATGDIALTITSPNNAKFRTQTIVFSNPSASLTTAQVGIFTNTGGTGVPIMANAALSALTTNSDNTSGNIFAATVATQLVINPATLPTANTFQLRVGTAQAATVDLTIYANLDC